MELRGKVAVVTGGARGIGAALARRFAGEGAAGIVVADVDLEGAAGVLEDIGPDRALAMRADVSREADVRALVDEAEAAFGPVDLFCANAGVAVVGGPEAADADWQRLWDVNVMAHVHAARVLVPGWVERGGGYLLGTISAAALVNHFGTAPYAVTKAAALSLYEWLAINHGDDGRHDDGVRVSALCPQGVRTAMLGGDALTERMLAPGALDPEAVAEAAVEGLAAERFLILPHPEVAEYFQRKAGDYDRWLAGMRRLRASTLAAG